MPRRISPLTDAIYYVTTKSDQTSKLEVKYISSEKGRGIFTLTSFDKGDFVAEYRGEMIDFIESQRRRRIYHDACGVFMFDFKWKGKTWCIDAAKEDGSFGRLVNDDHKHPNCRMKKIEVDRRPHLCLFALKDIKQGQEITYDYGGTDWPWRSKVMEDNPDENNVQEKHPSQSTSLLDHNTATSASVTEQHSSSEDSDEQDMCIPRLRRTKSVFMKDLIPDASDELFDSTPDSGEEYVPNSKDDSDESSSESSMIVKPLNLCRSDTDPVLPSSSVPDSTTPNVMDKSSHETMEVTDHSQVRDSDVACISPTNVQKNARVVVNSVKRKHDGGRVYNKKHYCLFCFKPYNKMARHLEYVHSTEKEVTEGCQFPKGSMQRKMFFNDLRHRGNYAHNAAVMKSGEGELVPYRQPQNQTEGTEFMHCAYCQGLFTRKVLWRHMKSCKLSTKDKISRPGKNRVQALCSYAQPVSSNISKALWKTVSHMNLDEITAAVKNDCCIIQVGEHLLNKGGISAKNEAYVRQKLRELGRLLVSGSKVASLKRMEDFLDPQNYMKTVKAVRHACGYDYQTNTYRTPSLAKKHGISLMKLSKLTKAKALINKDVDLAQKVTGFQDVHKEQWCDLISATAARNIEELKWNAPTVLPFTKDVQKLHTFLDKTQDECVKQLSSVSSTKYWSELAKTILTQIILFNRRREGEVSSMPLSAFLTRDTSDPHADVDWALSEVEKKLCRHFSRIVIRGKRGRPVPVLLTPKMLGALELLVKNRETCGVLKENVYLFARPTAMSHYRGLDCIRNFAKHCGADSPYALTSTKLRKQAATLSTVLNLRDTDLDQLANFLGHDIRIHREYYRLPEKTLQLAKVSKVLMALEQGRVGQFKGKNLDEITIDPNEEMELNSDEIMSEEGEKCEEHEDVGVPPVDTEIVHTVEMNSLQRSSKGKTSTLKKRKAWEVNEVTAVERHMKTFIMSCRVPGKLACQNCITAEPLALKDRDWQSVKFYVYNHIVAYKRDLNKND
ncbi:uncharacterized protein LOC125141181 isoform X1 [Tachysurus fulvidraco]|uniref:uncharacterized protein LOC125141181 isoform X1 n=1 Tax=Tachysurus fulvidraco TaxID=1234273 RepID=UPI001FEE6292|nr:uncharacterized protein LOC125141181 isoform X1 [Tachysurus fulvidraco]XP_047669345.1 uncharacterized protein LOC125141181 isoform X1 [Tachysurus fulvidraco]